MVPDDLHDSNSVLSAQWPVRDTYPMEGMAEGDRVVGVRVGHGWDADTSTPLVLLQLRTDAGAVGIVWGERCRGS